MAKYNYFDVITTDGTKITVYVNHTPYRHTDQSPLEDGPFTVTAEAITPDGVYHSYDSDEEVDCADELLEEMLRNIPMDDESIMRIHYKVAALCEPRYPDHSGKWLRELIKEGRLGSEADYYRYCAGVPMLHE